MAMPTRLASVHDSVAAHTHRVGSQHAALCTTDPTHCAAPHQDHYPAQSTGRANIRIRPIQHSPGAASTCGCTRCLSLSAPRSARPPVAPRPTTHELTKAPGSSAPKARAKPRRQSSGTRADTGGQHLGRRRAVSCSLDAPGALEVRPSCAVSFQWRSAGLELRHGRCRRSSKSFDEWVSLGQLQCSSFESESHHAERVRKTKAVGEIERHPLVPHTPFQY